MCIINTAWKRRSGSGQWQIASQRLTFVFAWIRLGERYDHASKSVYRRQNRFWPGTHTDIIRQVHPTNRAGRINQEFRRPRDVFIFCAALGMQHSVPTDRLSLGIGKKWKSIVSGLAELL